MAEDEQGKKRDDDTSTGSETTSGSPGETLGTAKDTEASKPGGQVKTPPPGAASTSGQAAAQLEDAGGDSKEDEGGSKGAAGSGDGGTPARARKDADAGDDGGFQRTATIAVVVLAVIVLAGTVTFFMGRRAGDARANAAEDAAAEARQAKEEAVADAKAETRRVRRELDDLRVRTLRLEAHRALSEAARHLDDRNFGLADEARARAIRLLRQSGASGGDWGELKDKVEELEFKVASDLFEQRLKVHRLLQRTDALLDGRRLPAAASAGSGDPAGDAAGDGATEDGDQASAATAEDGAESGEAEEG
ncbi:MAG TPA: hypothetical protein RMF84_18250 [Polyangiaceae bacterium LLY-WYZ-14_1]|nr:hypothetical protein [Polyangiaceae bacterium LLY-WYZ-14_1]